MLSMPNAPQFAVPTVPRAGMAQAATATPAADPRQEYLDQQAAQQAARRATSQPPAADPRQEYLDQQAARRAVSQPATSRREIADAASPASVVFVPYTGEESSSGGVGLLPLLAGGLIAYSLLKGK